jgi:hypothetical protein
VNFYKKLNSRQLVSGGKLTEISSFLQKDKVNIYFIPILQCVVQEFHFSVQEFSLDFVNT